MAAYYNEIDPFAAEWLRGLIKAGHIAPGDVDERSITDVRPDDLAGYTQCHFFAGIGVWSYALRQAGWPDDRPIWTGSCPCQPFSAAGKRGGFDDERHLWPSWQWLIQQCRPSEILGEQSPPPFAGAWIDLVQADLEAMDYAFGCVPFPSCGVGATHIRDRSYFCATDTGSPRLPWSYVDAKPRAQEIEQAWSEFTRIHAASAWVSWLSESGSPALIDGCPGRVGQTRAYGNAVNAEAAKEFIAAYMGAAETSEPLISSM